jgi:outer membrane protein TolC
MLVKKGILMLVLSLGLLANVSIEDSVNKQALIGDYPNHEMIDLSLNGLINEVVKRNYELLVEKSNIDISKHRVLLEEGVFEPKFQLSAELRRTNIPNSAEQAVSRGYQENYRDRVKDYGANIRGLLGTGAEWSIGFNDTKKESNLISELQGYGQEYSDGFNASFKQPLLRGMGMDITYAKINIAKVGVEINEAEYKNKLMNLISTTIHLYWRLYGNQKLLESWRETLALSEQQLVSLELLAKNGKISESEVLEAKSSIFQKKTELLSLKSNIKEISSQIFSLLNVSSSDFKSIFLIAKDSPQMGSTSTNFTIEESYRKAIAHLPELKLAELQLASERLEYKYNKNQLLPDLTLNSGISTLGLSSNKNNSLYCSTGCNGQVSWNVGVNLEVPIYGNDSARENLAISKINLKNSEMAIDAYQKEIYNAIEMKIEQLNVEKMKFVEYQKEVQLKEQLLIIERKKLELGRARMRDVLEYEDRLIYAQRKLFSAIVNWKVAEAILNKTTGELLAKQNIELYSATQDIDNLVFQKSNLGK